MNVFPWLLSPAVAPAPLLSPWTVADNPQILTNEADVILTDENGNPLTT